MGSLYYVIDRLFAVEAPLTLASYIEQIKITFISIFTLVFIAVFLVAIMVIVSACLSYIINM